MYMDIPLLRNQLNQTPPNTTYIQQILTAFKQGLFTFVPNKPEIHQLIKEDLPLDTLDILPWQQSWIALSIGWNNFKHLYTTV